MPFVLCISMLPLILKINEAHKKESKLDQNANKDQI